MRNLFRLGLIMLLAVIGGVASASIASAGGPTSLLITSPQNQRTSSAYIGDARYERLAEYVGMTTAAGVNQSTTGGSPPAGIDTQTGSEIRLTWLIHDMMVWRVDRIHLAGDVIWIQTMQDWDREGGEIGDGIWHRATEPEKLRAALSETGVLRKPAAGSADDPTAPAPSSEPTPSTDPAEQAAVAAGGPPPSGLIGAGFSVLGLAVGIGATLLTLRVRHAERRDRVVLTG
jgi:hypothetical protein